MRNCISWDFGEACATGQAFIIYNLINTSPGAPTRNIFACGDKWKQSCKTNPVWFVLTRSVFRQVALLHPPALLGTSCPSQAEKPKLCRSSSTVDLECTNLIRLEGREEGSGYTCKRYIPALTACRSCVRQESRLTTPQGSFQVIGVVGATKQYKKEKQQVLTFWEGTILFNRHLYMHCILLIWFQQ